MVILPAALWFYWGEAFLRRTHRVPSDVLIVEGWIGLEGVRAAKAEFEQGNYRYLVTTGGMTDNPWDMQRWNYAVEAHELLVRLKVPENRLIAAPAPDTNRQRTFAAAFAAHQELERRGIPLQTANIFTLGVHARRSRLVFAKVFPNAELGVISWPAAAYATVPWWQSSERAEGLLKETAGYFFELLLNSGRLSNSTPPPRD